MSSSLNLSKSIKFIISDFDGVFTDNTILITEDCKFTKKLNFRDIMGVSLAKKNGYKVGIISGEKSAPIDLLNEKFKLDEVHQGIRDKATLLKEIMCKYSLSSEEIVYLGDDVNDVNPMKAVKYAVCPADAHSKVKSLENVQISDVNGGCGFFRQVVDNLLEIQDSD